MTKKIVSMLTLCVVVAVSASAATVKVKQNGTPLRAEATTTSTPLAHYQKGDLLDLVDVTTGWYKVRDPKTGKEGFIPVTLADLLPGTVVPPPQGATKAVPPPGPTKPVPAAAQAPSPATQKPAAQKPAASSRRWTDIGYVYVSGGYQAGSSGFSESFSFPQYVEQVTVTTEYPKKDGPTFDVGGGVRVWRNFAAGVSVSGVSRSTDGDVNASIPHPFFFNTGRAIEGAAALKRTETAVHVQAAYVVPAGRRMLVTLSAGPSFFSVRQTLVQSVQFSESYPYDTALLSSVPTTSASKSVTGFNAGLDVGYYFTRNVGAGMLLRYAGGSLTLPSHDAAITTKVGGFQVAGGLRLRIPKPAAKKTPPKAPAPAPPLRK
jgi:hypothetical protein